MFWKLLLGETAILVLTGLGILFFAIPSLERATFQREKTSVAQLADLLAMTVDTHEPPSQERIANTLPASHTQLRWYDPQTKTFSPDDPTGRSQAEVDALLAAKGNELAFIRESGRPHHADHSIRIARRVGDDRSNAPILHLTRSLVDLDRSLMETQTRLFSWLAVGGVGLALVNLMLTQFWSRRLRRIQQEMGLLVDGSARSRLTSSILPDDETNRLARLAREVKQSVTVRVDGIDQVRRDLQTMLETIPEAVLAIDADQRVLFANASTYRLFGLPLDDIAGKKLWAILRQPGLQDAVSMTFAAKEPTSTEFAIRRPPRVVRYFGRGLTVGSGRGIIIVLHDITELRRLERLRQDFFASVSHELKTPLAAIKAYTETLLDDEQQDRDVTRRFLLRVEEQADRLHSLVIDMLMLARVESEDHGFDIKPIDARPAILNSVDYFREKAESKSVSIESRLLADPCIVMADSEGLGMIVRNLVDNAVKYTPAGGQVTVTTSLDESDVVIEVIDTGVGIPADDLHRIFERFYRVDKARSRELGGTGLGLSIVKHLVQRFGGTVSVRSRLGEGSTFTVTLPLAVGRSQTKQNQLLVEQETIA
jgi:two-component system phosphate regulon sensor histidine kinase PhoR